MRNTYLATDAALAFSRESHASIAVAQAIEAGCLDPDGAGSFTHPDLLDSGHEKLPVGGHEISPPVRWRETSRSGHWSADFLLTHLAPASSSISVGTRPSGSGAGRAR